MSYMCPNLRIRGHLPASIINGGGDSLGKWTNFPNKFEGLVTLTLTLDRFILHAAMDHSSTSTYIPNFIEIEETFVDGRTDGRTDGHLRPPVSGRLGGVELIKGCQTNSNHTIEIHTTVKKM